MPPNAASRIQIINKKLQNKPCAQVLLEWISRKSGIFQTSLQQNSFGRNKKNRHLPNPEIVQRDQYPCLPKRSFEGLLNNHRGISYLFCFCFCLRPDTVHMLVQLLSSLLCSAFRHFTISELPVEVSALTYKSMSQPFFSSIKHYKGM